MLFCPFPKNLGGRLLDDYTLGLGSFFKSGKITEKIPKYRYYRYFFMIYRYRFFSIRQQPTCNGDISALKDKVMPMAVLLKVVSCMDIKILKRKVLKYVQSEVTGF